MSRIDGESGISPEASNPSSKDKRSPEEFVCTANESTSYYEVSFIFRELTQRWLKRQFDQELTSAMYKVKKRLEILRAGHLLDVSRHECLPNDKMVGIHAAFAQIARNLERSPSQTD